MKFTLINRECYQELLGWRLFWMTTCQLGHHISTCSFSAPWVLYGVLCTSHLLKSRDIDFSFCLLLAYARTAGTFLSQIPGKGPRPQWICKCAKEYHILGGNQKPGISTALLGHLLGKSTVLSLDMPPLYQAPLVGLWLQMNGAFSTI